MKTPFSYGGVVITGNEVEGYSVGNTTIMSQEVVSAFRAFFQAERDEELGRWRSLEDPECTVYSDEDGEVMVLDEMGITLSSIITPADAQRFHSTNHLIAREYFAAHRDEPLERESGGSEND